MMKWIVLCLSLLVLTSCLTRKRCNRKFPPEIIVKDSIHVETTIEYRDTIIYAPADTIVLTDTIECDELGRVNMPERTVSSNQATVKVSIKNNELRVEANCDSLEIELQKMKEIRTTEKTHHHKEIQIKKERYIPGFYQFCKWYFIFTASIGVLFILAKRAFRFGS